VAIGTFYFGPTRRRLSCLPQVPIKVNLRERGRHHTGPVKNCFAPHSVLREFLRSAKGAARTTGPARSCFAPPVRSSSSRRAPVHDFRGISKSMLLPWTTLGRLRPACGPPLREPASRCCHPSGFLRVDVVPVHNFLSSSTRLRAPVHDDRGISKSMLFPWITSGDLRPGCGHDFPGVSERPAGPRRPVVSERAAGPPARFSSSLCCPSAQLPVVFESPAGAALRFARVPQLGGASGVFLCARGGGFFEFGETKPGKRDGWGVEALDSSIAAMTRLLARRGGKWLSGWRK
jgi:hypothetical protein